MASRTCWYCGNKTHMTLADDAHRVRVVKPGTGYLPNHVAYCALYLCDECRSPSIALAVDASSGYTSMTDWMLGRYGAEPTIHWIPENAVGREFPDVSEHIASAANEAYVCSSVEAYRGAGALARAVIEATAKDKGITTGKLFHKIEAMEKQGLIRAHIKEAAHEVRHLGNDVAHGDFIDPTTKEETEETLELMSEVLNEVYQSPAKITRRQAARTAKKSGVTP
jgi:hypothetical protein